MQTAKQSAARRTGRYSCPLNIHDRPLAGAGLTSYRYKGKFGFVMIGALSVDDALVQAQRSISTTPDVGHLEVWDGNAYIPAAFVQEDAA